MYTLTIFCVKNLKSVKFTAIFKNYFTSFGAADFGFRELSAN